MAHSYERLSNGDSLPSNPPAYEGFEENTSGGQAPPIEQFEIDDDEVFEPLKRDTLIKRISFTSKKLAFSFRDKVVDPLCRMFIPLFEIYTYFSQRWESSLLKLGNPLVVKRLLYVAFAVTLVFVVMENENNDGVNGASGGAFSSGKFFDRERLGNTLAEYIEPRALQENLEYLSSIPHMAGTKGDLALAKYIKSFFNNNGISDIDFNEIESYLNFPQPETYVRLSDGSFTATLHAEEEPARTHALAFNPGALNTELELDLPYIYVNYGDPEDFQKLVDAKIELKDTILLMKYGGGVPEPNKVVAATRVGAKAVVFITPEVSFTGENVDTTIRKTNVGLYRVSPGDILSTGRSSSGSYVFNKWNSSPITPKLPTIPISWKDGKTLLEKLGKDGVDFGDGFLSGSQTSPKLNVNIQNAERVSHPIWNVVGFIPGREQPDKGIIIGAGRDSSCYGAMTSASGTAVLLELVKIFSGLQRRYNWTPSRSIYFISFDGTEYNLAGAAEWVKSKKKLLLGEGYTYIDLNGMVSGDTLLVKSHPLLHNVIYEALRKVKITNEQKEKHSGSDLKNLYDLLRAQNGDSVSISNNMLDYRNYIPFINELNLPSMEILFKDKLFVDGTCLDTFQVFSKKGFDPLMKKHQQITELIARIALELAENPIIPFDFIGLSQKLKEYQVDLEKYVANKIVESGTTAQPIMSYDGMTRAIERLRLDSHQLGEMKKNWEQYTAASAIEPPVFASTRKQLNLKMVSFGAVFLNNDNQLSRLGYANYLFGTPYDAPTGDDEKYQWNTFPMIRDLAAEFQFGNAQAEINRVASLISLGREAISPMF